MPLQTIVVCDRAGCPNKYDVTERAPKGAENVLQVTDALGNKFVFCSRACLAAWLPTYRTSSKNESVDTMLPGIGI